MRHIRPLKTPESRIGELLWLVLRLLLSLLVLLWLVLRLLLSLLVLSLSGFLDSSNAYLSLYSRSMVNLLILITE